VGGRRDDRREDDEPELEAAAERAELAHGGGVVVDVVVAGLDAVVDVVLAPEVLPSWSARLARKVSASANEANSGSASTRSRSTGVSSSTETPVDSTTDGWNHSSPPG